MVIVKLAEVETREMAPGCYARIVHSKNMTLVYWDIRANHLIPEHAHPHEQVMTLTEGIFELTMDGETRTVDPGSVVVIPSNAMHKGKGITDCKIMDVFYPIREDYLNTVK